MTKMKCVIVFIACLSSVSLLAGQQVADAKGATPLDAERERHALQSLSRIIEKEIISAVDAMPADKFGFAPTDGELCDLGVSVLARVLQPEPFPASVLVGSFFLVCQSRILENHELFSAALTPKGSHIPHFGRSFSRLPLLDRYRLHADTRFYPAFRLPPIP